MANHKSSKKRIVRNANRALINGARMSRIRTFVKKVEIAIELNPDNVEMMDKIVADFRIKDRSKAFRVLLDYVVDNEKAWDEMFKRKRCKRCY